MDDPTPNPFGFVDHSAFAGFGVDLVWGLNAAGEAVHISAAARGLACGLICPACKAPLIARKGAKKAAHFSHQGKDSGCGSGRETNAHYWAKQLLIEKKQIWTPVVTAVVEGVSRQESKARWMTFRDVRSECRLGRIVPDIVLILADGRELIVEICVTHPCGDDKIALIEANGWPAIEISLRHLRTCQDIAMIEIALLKDAPRSWLCNPRRDRAEEALRVELAKAAAKRAEAERQKAAREADRLRREADAVAADAQDLLRAAADARASTRPPTDPAVIRSIDADEGQFIGITKGGEGFSMTQSEWQATLVERFVSIGDIRNYEDETFSLDDALDLLEPMIVPAFRNRPTDKVRGWIAQRHPSFRFPREAVNDYLDALCLAGGLQSEGSGHYGIPDDVAKEIRREQRRLIEIEHQAQAAHALLDQMITDLPPDEAFEFEPQSWLQAPLAHSGATPNQILSQGGPAYADLMSRLRALAKMVAGGEDAIDVLLGLPLEAARYRAVERMTARRSREAAERTRRLREAATRLLAGEAQAWLTAPIDVGGETPLALASAGGAGLDRGLATIAAIGRQREAERVEAAAIAARRDKLQAAVAKLFAPSHRQLALRNHAPALGCSPWDACRTDHGFEAAIRILTNQAGGLGRRR